MTIDDEPFRAPGERVALVTGAASGIGEAIVRGLAAAGIGKLVLVDLHDGAARRAAAKLGRPPEDLLVRGQHVADEAAWRDTEALIAERFGRLDLVVANAGVADGSPLDETSFERWRHVLSTNLDGVFLTLRSGLKLLRAGGRGGAVLVVASVAALRAEPGTGAYAASKAGAVQLARVAAREGATAGIRVNALLPGGVETPIWRDVPFFRELVAETGSEAAAFARMGATGTPLGRFATADEIAGHALFLLSDRAASMTGAAHVVDGGYAL
jgi:NAD(P)-dependent dehydrogenase (short-subunit alcohol dehydrogenase family)